MVRAKQQSVVRERKKEKTKTISWGDPKINKRDAAASISGLDYLKAIKQNKIGPPPVAHLVGYKIVDVENGYAAFELAPAEYHYNPFETVHGGVLYAHGVSTCSIFRIMCSPSGL